MTEQSGFGLRFSEDPRDRLFQLRAVTTARRNRTWYSLGVLDQGGTSQCVAYSGVKYLTSAPVIQASPMAPGQLYHECQLIDEWDGESYDGTSVRALFKVLKSIGLIAEYRWAFDVATVVDHLLEKGPVVVGTVWTMDMFTPDRWGYIWPAGEATGGHAYLLIGANRDRRNPDGSRGAVRLINSWGENWGSQRGRAWMTIAALDQLIRNDGEACVANEVRASR